MAIYKLEGRENADDKQIVGSGNRTPKKYITKEHWAMQKQHLDGNEADDEK